MKICDDLHTQDAHVQDKLKELRDNFAPAYFFKQPLKPYQESIHDSMKLFLEKTGLEDPNTNLPEILGAAFLPYGYLSSGFLAVADNQVYFAYRGKAIYGRSRRMRDVFHSHRCTGYVEQDSISVQNFIDSLPYPGRTGLFGMFRELLTPRNDGERGTLDAEFDSERIERQLEMLTPRNDGERGTLDAEFDSERIERHLEMFAMHGKPKPPIFRDPKDRPFPPEHSWD